MITYVVCDLFESPARVLVNTVNTVGVMGKGIAKDFKLVYPEMFRDYQILCEKKALDIGKLWLYRTPNKWVLNFPTKRHWRHPSRPEYIEAGLAKFVETYHLYGISSISFPLLGCGNGELDWQTQVRPLMERYLDKLPIAIFVHLYRPDPYTPEHRDIQVMKEWLRSEPESLAFSEVWDDLRSLLKAPTELSSLDGRERFRVELDQTGNGLRLIINEKTIPIPHDALMELWQQLRQSGFVVSDSMPSGFDSMAGYVIPIISKLPYVKPVQLASHYTKVNSRAIGLRLAPRPLTDQSTVAVNSGAVLPV
jgi:O-acetyl-ADP-ribose deacetylase (regulator of RNase III)